MTLTCPAAVDIANLGMNAQKQSAGMDAIMVGHVYLPIPAIVPLDGLDLLAA